MNFNEQNSSGLLGLVAALKAGMDPATAQSLFSGIEQQQGMQIAQRQERLSGLADLLSQKAMAGMPYAGAEALMEAQPGPAGPAAQNILSSLYPDPGSSTPGLNPEFAQTQYDPDPMTTGTPIQGPTFEQYAGAQQSPAYQPDPMAQLQLQEQEAQTGMAVQQANFASEWPVFQQAMTMARAQQISPYDALARFSAQNPDNAALIASDAGKTAMSIMEAIWGPQAMAMASQPTV